MTDSAKWKSVMLRVDTYELLKEVAARDRRPIASILTDLVFREWEWHFAKDYQPNPDQIAKEPERRTTDQRPRNPFLSYGKDPGVDR